ncbi:MAG: hypothetical protein OXC30_00075 [Alphaproteobacteria bacterium]|nr:hypothetical protein [Alphaproteobacteria bacterium]
MKYLFLIMLSVILFGVENQLKCGSALVKDPVFAFIGAEPQTRRVMVKEQMAIIVAQVPDSNDDKDVYDKFAIVLKHINYLSLFWEKLYEIKSTDLVILDRDMHIWKKTGDDFEVFREAAFDNTRKDLFCFEAFFKSRDQLLDAFAVPYHHLVKNDAECVALIQRFFGVIDQAFSHPTLMLANILRVLRLGFVWPYFVQNKKAIQDRRDRLGAKKRDQHDLSLAPAPPAVQALFGLECWKVMANRKRSASI